MISSDLNSVQNKGAHLRCEFRRRLSAVYYISSERRTYEGNNVCSSFIGCESVISHVFDNFAK